MCTLDTILNFVNENLEVTANILLFVSALILLIDTAPVDYSSKQKKIRQAIELLREKKNILGPIPTDINIAPEGAVSVFRDEAAFHYLLEFIFKNAPRANSFSGNQIIGIGYSAISVPVDNNILEAFFPLYFALMPETMTGAQVKLVPVGKLEDLDNWITKLHNRSLTRAALYMLVIGFFLQLLSTLTH